MNPRKEINGIEFTKVELEIIRLICREFTNAEIADELDMSKRTIEGIRIEIVRKTNSKNIAGVVIFALRHGIYKVRGITGK